MFPLPAFGNTALLCGLYSDPAGRPRLGFPAEKFPVEGEAVDEPGISGMDLAIAPSGPYFLGLPLFFLSNELASPALAGDGATGGVPVTGVELSVLGAI